MYSLIIFFAVLIASLIGEKVASQYKRSTEVYWKCLFIVLLFGFVGARLYHVIDYIDLYKLQPLEIFNTRNGGVGILGGLIGGLIGGYIYLKRKKEPILMWLDIGAMVTPLAQSIGRWANFFNKELYGTPTNLPWGLYIPKDKRLLGYENYERFHPLFLYESVLCLILFLVLMYVFKKSKKVGIVFPMYLFGYGLIRFSLEFLRIRPWQILGLNVAQAISILLMLVSLVFLKTRLAKKL